MEGTWKIKMIIISGQDKHPKLASRGLENKNCRVGGEYIVTSNSIMHTVELGENLKNLRREKVKFVAQGRSEAGKDWRF